MIIWAANVNILEIYWIQNVNREKLEYSLYIGGGLYKFVHICGYQT